MPLIRIDNVGQHGIIRDVPDYELPPNAWSDGKNIEASEGKIIKRKGSAITFSSPAVAPYYVYPVEAPWAYYWIYAGLNKVYVVQNLYHHNITRESSPGVLEEYNASEQWGWTATNLNGVIVLNNGVDAPQYWSWPTASDIKLQNLPNWPTNYRARNMRAFKNYLIALDIYKAGTQYPHMVKWSDVTSSGSVPGSWDESDTTGDAGENELTEGGGALIEQLQLRDMNILYRSDSTWAMQYIGGNAIWRFYRLFLNSGIMSQRCVKEFFNKHLVFSNDDVIVHDGQNIQSVIDNKMRKWLFNNIDTSNYDRSFVTPGYPEEMWICFPQSGQTNPDTAIVWNYKENTWSVRDLPNAAHLGWGQIDVTSNDAWDKPLGNYQANSSTYAAVSSTYEQTGTLAWSANNNAWDGRTYNALNNGILAADPTNTRLIQLNTTEQELGVDMTSYVTRTGIALIGPNKTDTYARKFLRAIYPKMEGTTGGVINVYVGSQETTDDAVTWSSAKEFIIGTDYKVDCKESGRLLSVKFESTTDITWSLSSYEMDIEVGGRR